MDQVKFFEEKTRRTNNKEKEELEKKTIKVVEAMLKKEINLFQRIAMSFSPSIANTLPMKASHSMMC